MAEKAMSKTDVMKKLAGIVPLLTSLGVGGINASVAGNVVSLNVTVNGISEEHLKTIVDLVNSKLTK